MKNALLLVVGVLCLLPTIAFAQDAVVEEISGKVEVRPMGGTWTAATVGMSLSGGDTVSTGFGASASIAVGNSTVTLTPLTRLTLEELLQREDTQQTRLFLQVGKVRADVKTAEGLNHDFQLRSASTTASVRGTSFEFDGISVRGFTGEVQVSNLAGHGRRVIRGETVSAEGVAPPVPAEREKERRTTVQAPAALVVVDESEPAEEIVALRPRIEVSEVVEVLGETLDLDGTASNNGELDIRVNWPE